MRQSELNSLSNKLRMGVDRVYNRSRLFKEICFNAMMETKWTSRRLPLISRRLLSWIKRNGNNLLVRIWIRCQAQSKTLILISRTVFKITWFRLRREPTNKTSKVNSRRRCTQLKISKIVFRWMLTIKSCLPWGLTQAKTSLKCMPQAKNLTKMRK